MFVSLFVSVLRPAGRQWRCVCCWLLSSLSASTWPSPLCSWVLPALTFPSQFSLCPSIPVLLIYFMTSIYLPYFIILLISILAVFFRCSYLSFNSECCVFLSRLIVWLQLPIKLSKHQQLPVIMDLLVVMLLLLILLTAKFIRSNNVSLYQSHSIICSSLSAFT